MEPFPTQTSSGLTRYRCAIAPRALYNRIGIVDHRAQCGAHDRTEPFRQTKRLMLAEKSRISSARRPGCSPDRLDFHRVSIFMAHLTHLSASETDASAKVGHLSKDNEPRLPPASSRWQIPCLRPILDRGPAEAFSLNAPALLCGLVRLLSRQSCNPRLQGTRP